MKVEDEGRASRRGMPKSVSINAEHIGRHETGCVETIEDGLVRSFEPFLASRYLDTVQIAALSLGKSTCQGKFIL